MELFTTFKISSSALRAQRIRLDTISSNLANIETTSTPEGGPYKRKSVYFEAKPVTFAEHLANQTRVSVQGVEVTKIIEDNSPPQQVYDPGHPDANEEGYVAIPNISVLKETVDMMNATRAYQANATAIKSAKRMALKALEIGG